MLYVLWRRNLRDNAFTNRKIGHCRKVYEQEKLFKRVRKFLNLKGFIVWQAPNTFTLRKQSLIYLFYMKKNDDVH